MAQELKWYGETTHGEPAHHYVTVYEKEGKKIVQYDVTILTQWPDQFYGYEKIRKVGDRWMIARTVMIRHEALELLFQCANNLILNKEYIIIPDEPKM